MKIRQMFPVLMLVAALPFMNYVSVNRDKSVEGTWIRKSDNLMVQIAHENASILKEGNEKFPCNVSDLLIYKDIHKVNDNLWNCKFLVVTMGSCQTNYESGEMFISKQGELVVVCPGFDSKVYTKAKPRYNSSHD